MTSDRIPALLEPIQNRLDAATPGPWTDALGKTFKAVGSIADAHFIVNAPTDQARLLAAVQAVERTAKNLDRLADGDRYYANLFRKAVIEALGGEA